MAMKMDRRTFLKTTAAAAVAVSMTGLLGGCSEGSDGVDLGGYSAKVLTWDTDEHKGSLNSDTPWWAEFKVKVSLKNLDQGDWRLQSKGQFKLLLDGESQELMKGDGDSDTLPMKDSWLIQFSKSGETRIGWLKFKVTDQELFNKITSTTVVKFTAGVDPMESYTLDYAQRVFVKDVK